MNHKVLHMVAWILLVVGGLNWGLTAFDLNVVAMLGATVAKVVYILVGLAALFELINHKKSCLACKSGGGTAPM